MPTFTTYISSHWGAYQRMWPMPRRHNLKSHQHSGAECASMVGHTDQDWIAVETWGQGYQLCSASQYPRSLTPFQTPLLARNGNKSFNRKSMGNHLYRSQDQPFCFIGSLSTPTNPLHFQGWKSGATCCQFRPCAPLPPPGTPALEDRGLHSYTSTPNSHSEFDPPQFSLQRVTSWNIATTTLASKWGGVRPRELDDRREYFKYTKHRAWKPHLQSFPR